MKKAWFALAALAGIAVAGVIADRLPQPSFDKPLYVAIEPPSSAEACAAWQARAMRRAKHWRASLEAFEGFSRYQGACHPKDQATGRAMIESAIAKGAGEALFIEYFLALATHGDSDRADREFPIVAEILVTYPGNHRKLMADWERLLPFVLRERAEFRNLDQWAAIVERVDHVLSRPTIAARAERAYLDLLLLRVREIDEYAGSLLTDKVGRMGRIDLPKGRHRDMYLDAAANCGNAEAIRHRAQLYISGGLFQPNAEWIAQSLIWLEEQEGKPSDLLAKVTEMGKFRPFDNDRWRAIESYEDVKARNCGTRTK